MRRIICRRELLAPTMTARSAAGTSTPSSSTRGALTAGRAPDAKRCRTSRRSLAGRPEWRTPAWMPRPASRRATSSLAADEYVTSDEGFSNVAAERRLGRVPVLLVRMNADLVMGEELKKPGAGNLFTVFGEPDIEIKHEGDELRVVLRGVDVYDPNSGELRSDDADQIALWMIDTAYNRCTPGTGDCSARPCSWRQAHPAATTGTSSAGCFWSPSPAGGSGTCWTGRGSLKYSRSSS